MTYAHSQHKMAKEELNAIKRKQTIGKKWNSAMIFSVMWSVYCICLLLYFAVDPDGCVSASEAFGHLFVVVLFKNIYQN